MKTMCIAAAIKTVKDLETEKGDLRTTERATAVLEEVDGELVHNGPDYNFNEAQCRLAALDETIRNIRHAINVSNATTTVAALGMTPDCVLVAMAQKNRRLAELQGMLTVPERERCESFGRSGQTVYRVRQYDTTDIKSAIDSVRREIRELQLELDRHNLTTEISFETV